MKTAVARLNLWYINVMPFTCLKPLRWCVDLLSVSKLNKSHMLQDQFSGQLNITVDKLEGKSLRQQAALYNNASIVIQTHGAALGTCCFAQHGKQKLFI